MADTLEHLKELKEIRSLMDKSSRFISLSGLSGVFAGIYALIGAAAAAWYLNLHLVAATGTHYMEKEDFYLFFFIDAGLVLLFTIGTGILLTVRQTKKKGQKIWDSTSRRLIVNVAIPMMAGGGFIIGLLYHGLVGLVAPATLVFYGLALLNGSKYTLTDIRYLAFCQIGLGLISMFFIGYGLLFWVTGFGFMHIIYGTVMYFKYEK
ncbi:hypothetical protein RCC89_12730 [Cytophagaceae bacterium ABcell3]|nr:hypothetical protein RCC89_12730 [Cytophagaceae bacterium ABcell3]